ncbi:MAG: hypothetical protein HC927_00970 [Deltaproteobacteria bacterium]|nr:hypothetical protein [Deltaproteobacteria bacterium]
MLTTIILQLALLFSAPTDVAPDACSVTHRQSGYPTICEPHPFGAPVYAQTICCAGGTCFPSAGGCQDGEQLFGCELGDVDETGRAHCYFEVPEYCDVHTCPPGEGGWATYLCCMGDVCELQPGWAECMGKILWCYNGVSNDDGTVTCLDDEAD